MDLKEKYLFYTRGKYFANFFFANNVWQFFFKEFKLGNLKVKDMIVVSVKFLLNKNYIAVSFYRDNHMAEEALQLN